MATKIIHAHFLVLLAVPTCFVLGDDSGTSRLQAGSAEPQAVRAQLERRAATLRSDVMRAAEKFERDLNPVAQSEETAEFVLLLDWPRVKSEIEKVFPDLLLLRAYSKRLYEPFGSVRLETAIELRAALDDYTDVLRVLRYPNIESEIQRRQAIVRELLASNARLDTMLLGEHVDWLELVGRAPQLPSIQQQYDQPNIAVDIPKAVATERIKQFNQEVNQSQYVSNVVAGTPISGVTYTSGTATAQLLPAESAAGFKIELQGVINAPNNVAVQDPVVVYTSGQTYFQATKQVVWDGKKLSWGPSLVSCQTQSAITGIEVTRQPILPLRSRPGPLNRVIQRAAWRRAAQQQPQGESAASRLAENRVAESLDEQVSELVGKLNGQLDEYVTRPLLQAGMMPVIDAVIEPEAICVSLLRKGPSGLAGSKRPDWDINKEEFALHVHESALTSFLRESAGGAVWTDRKFSDLQRAVIGTNSYELRIGLHKRWQANLDWARPLTTRFDQGLVTIQINVESLRIEQEDFHFPFSVEATYGFDTRPPSLGFKREGDVRFSWTSDMRPEPGDEETLSSFIRQKFSGFLMDELHLDGLKVPSGGGFWGSLGGYHASDANSAQGWMVITFAEESTD